MTFNKNMMNSKKIFYWGAQITGWFIFVFIVILSSYIKNPKSIQTDLIIDLTTFIVIAIIISHFQRRIYKSKKWLELKLKPLIPRVIIISFTASFIVVIINAGINRLTSIKNEPFEVLNIINATLSVSILFFFWNVLYFTFHFFSKARQQEIHNLSLIASKNEIELQNLRSQLNPHFLFNSLNSIRALIEINPSESKYAITQLSNLLRKSLLIGKINLISIQEEMDIVHSYLKLEKIRFEKRLNYSVKIDENILHFKIPPFCIQLLIENAIKHGISKEIEGGEVSIEGNGFGNEIKIEVTNPGKIGKEKDLGVGLTNLRRRLILQYTNASFTIKNSENKKCVVSTIRIQQ